MSRCAVIGAGAWGTALADVLAGQGHDVWLWAYEPEVAEEVRTAHTNSTFLPDVRVNPAIRATSELAEAVDGAQLVVYAPPSHVLRRLARQASTAIATGSIVVVATKGIEEGTLSLTTEIAAEEHHGCAVVALSGPSFAAEVVRDQPTAVVAASREEEARLAVQRAFSRPTFRVYTTDDVTGVAVGGALKNVVAIASGISDGLALGFNPRAALITRALAEMTRLGVALGARAETFAGLTGIGDLVLTCTGALSRNRALGEALGRGRTLEQAMAGRQTVAEGVQTARTAHALAHRREVEMPIVDAVRRILFDGHDPRQALIELMTRELRPERDA
ncbi:MAG TPA: NAD(P)H-dependent glycerol-3-phosphate dehydrogenase [Gemmatimonadaceae bacterium]|nr:NAD(P)H-dependent glycerol-3-phosphate dehydrogenase [Gemmatimonadaceae bacterium]